MTTNMNYVGNCINSFDEDCECVVNDLPWNDATDFVQALEDSTETDPFEIPSHIGIDKLSHYFHTEDNIYIAYDDDADIHYFFVTD